MEAFAEEIWIASGPTVQSAGFTYPTRMAVIRLEDGGLFVCSPVALSAELSAALKALGDVRFVIAPNSLHHMALPEWRAAYHDARFYAAPGLRARRKDIAFDGDLTEAPMPWADEIDCVLVQGNAITTEAVFFHRRSGAVLFTDLLQNFPPDWFKGWRALIARLDGMLAPSPRVPQKFRVAFTNRKAARASIAAILAWPAQRVLMAHGSPVRQDGAAFLRRAFSWLMR
ncbi:MAG TPA: DUF4336 domain-containing protein [Terricaulis sp.]|nr:DUF4336 domain-containing protein [Terricaulis sp.]